MRLIIRTIWFGAGGFWALALLIATLGHLDALYVNFVQKKVEAALTLGFYAFLLSEVMTGIAIIYLGWLTLPKPRTAFTDLARCLWIGAFFFPIIGLLGSLKGLPDVTGTGILLFWSAIPQYVALLLVIFGKWSRRSAVTS